MGVVVILGKKGKLEMTVQFPVGAGIAYRITLLVVDVIGKNMFPFVGCLKSGIPAGLIRVSFGLEDSADLIADIAQALH